MSLCTSLTVKNVFLTVFPTSWTCGVCLDYDTKYLVVLPCALWLSVNILWAWFLWIICWVYLWNVLFCCLWKIPFCCLHVPAVFIPVVVVILWLLFSRILWSFIFKFEVLSLSYPPLYDALLWTCVIVLHGQEKHVEEIQKSLSESYAESSWSCSTSKLGYSGTAIISRVRIICIVFVSELSVRITCIKCKNSDHSRIICIVSVL